MLSPLIPLLTGYRNRRSLLWLYCFVGFVFEWFISLARRGLHINYFLPSNIYLLTEFVLVCFLFRSRLIMNRYAFWTLLFGLSALFIVHTVAKGPQEFNTSGAALFSLSYIVLSIAGLAQILQSKEVLFLDKYWFFWLCIAFLIYASGNILLFLFRLVMIKADFQLYRILWFYLYCPLNIAKNLFFAIALSRYAANGIRQPG